jgi:Fur family ferric uptake transcriptional regulator
VTPRETAARADWPSVETHLEAFAAHLQRKGLRMTPEREAVVRWVAAASGHFGPDEIVTQLLRKRVSRATIYRTLDLMREAGLVQRLELGSLGVRYERELGRAHHDHLACLACGRLIEFVSPDIERLQDEVCRAHEFTPVRHLHRIMGHCRACREKGRDGGGTTRAR